jgi:SET domain-containing protein
VINLAQTVISRYYRAPERKQVPAKLLRMNKNELLQEIRDNTYTMLMPSPVAGVGVFAIVDIPKGCRDMFSKPGEDDDWVELDRSEVDRLPSHTRQLIENYCLFDDSVYYVPAGGFKTMDVSLFINHGDLPNLVSVEDGKYFEAVRDIKAGEELFLDYGTIVDDES